MGDISLKNENGVCTVYLHDRIDTNNVEQIEASIENLLSGETYDTLVLDASDLNYISSAGLRMVLRISKKNSDLRIINVGTEVYEVFEMTGFTEMLKIEKAYRQFSVEGCEVIGQGANGIVYRVDQETIVKLFFKQDCLDEIKQERELARTAFVLGIPTAISYDVVKVGNQFGAVYELLNAESFASLIAKHPDQLEYYTGLYVDLLKKIHSTEVTNHKMPDMKEVALDWVSFLKDYIPADQFEKLYALVDAVPSSNFMIHGDYHMKNVMMQNGEVLLIDMDTLSVGNPVFELASIYLAFCGYGENDHSLFEKFMGLPYEVTQKIWYYILHFYFETEDEEKLREYDNKFKLVGYVRMMRRTIRRDGFNNEAGKKDIASCKAHIEELLKTVDTLLL